VHVGATRKGGGDDVDAFRERSIAWARDRFGPVVEGAGDLARPRRVATGDEHAIDAGRVQQLAGGANAHLAEPDDENGGHRKSGPWSSRHPPDVGGTGPLLRILTNKLTATAAAATRSPRCTGFTARAP
jgi:hypothetical protein